MKYYTYRLVLQQDPRYYYYGVHKTLGDPSTDSYFGSGRGVQEFKVLYGKNCFSKEILGIFSTRKESLLEEKRLVGDLWKTDPFCLNRMPGGAFDGEFDSTGLITYHSGSKVRHIKPEAVEAFENAGWTKGIPEYRIKQLKEYVTVHRDTEERRIPREDLCTWEQEGWSKGRPENIVEELKSRVHVTNGSITKIIKPQNLQEYIDRGWTIGHAPEHTKRSTAWNKGSIWIQKEGLQTKVRREDLEKYIKEGWSRGFSRKPKSEEERERCRETQIGRIWVSSITGTKKIYPEELDNYIKQGWIRGRTVFKPQKGTTTGRVKIWYPATGERKTVGSEKLKTFLDTGWKQGRGW